MSSDWGRVNKQSQSPLRDLFSGSRGDCFGNLKATNHEPSSLSLLGLGKRDGQTAAGEVGSLIVFIIADWVFRLYDHAYYTSNMR